MGSAECGIKVEAFNVLRREGGDVPERSFATQTSIGRPFAAEMGIWVCFGCSAGFKSASCFFFAS